MSIVRVAGLDVGIKTLSFCIMEYTMCSNVPPKIIDWRVINLLDPNDDGCVHNCNIDACDNNAIRAQQYCSKHIGGKNCVYIYIRGKKEGEICGAKCYLGSADYCKSHLPKDYGDIETNCQYIFLRGNNKFEMCGKKCVNTPYCKTHEKIATSAKYKKQAAKLKRRPPRISDTNLAATLSRRLDEFPDLLTANRILIENQPKIAGRMKKLSRWIQMYFVIRGMVDKKIYERVIMLSARHKLKIQPPGLQLERNNTYENRKKNAIKTCQYMISNSKKYSEWFRSLRKKDDPSDAFLMCYYYLKTYYFKNNID